MLAHPGQVDVRIAAKAAGLEEARALIAPVEAQVRGLLGIHVFATDDQTMEAVVGGLLDQKGLTIASYEDLTGGMTAERLQEAGPDRFIEGVIGNGVGSVRRVSWRRRAAAWISLQPTTTPGSPTAWPGLSGR